MSVISSRSLTGEGVPMSDQIAKADIVEKNAAGQYVVLVPKGQPIPARLVEQEKPAAKKVAAPAENKARRMKRADS